MDKKSFHFLTISLLVALTALSCQKKPEEEAASATKYLYVASGICYSGNGITTFTTATASNLVFRIRTADGKRESIVADYSAAPASGGDSPVAIESYDDKNLLVVVRNGTTGRGIEIVPKDGSSRSNFGLNPGAATVLATAPQSIRKTKDGGYLIARTGFIEKITSTGVRMGAPWVNSNLGATCGAANALYTAVLESKESKIITMNAAASPANRLISVPALGANGSCTAAQAAPAATTYPVAAVYDSAHTKLIVAYAGSTTATDINSIYAYSFDETTGAISSPQKIYDSALYPASYNFLLFGISSMTLDETNNYLYVASAISSATTVVNYKIEKLSYNAAKIAVDNTTVLTREGTTPFYDYGVDTKCISSMRLSN